MIELLALDLDGTIVGDDGVISLRNRQALAAAQARGVEVTLATGRMFQATLPFARELRIAAPLICYQGSMVRSPSGDPPIVHRTVPLDLAHRVVEWTRERGLAVSAYVDDELYTDRVTPDTLYDAQLSQVELHSVDDLLALLATEPTKLAIVTDGTGTDEIVLDLARAIGDRLRVVKTHPRFVEATHPQVSKGWALAQLAHWIGVPQENVMAAGDNDNDAEMIAWAGLGVAMGNASPHAREAADHLAPRWEEDGLAWAVERFILK
jgi:Cof subfamily protein (haloacid dehalogenase superfamily)